MLVTACACIRLKNASSSLESIFSFRDCACPLPRSPKQSYTVSTINAVEVLTESEIPIATIADFIVQSYYSLHTNHILVDKLPFGIEQIRICESIPAQKYVFLKDCEIKIHQYYFLPDSFPKIEYQYLWDSLVFEEDVKSKLIDFISTGFLFSDMRVNPRIISVNKLILLHGPPGYIYLIRNR